MMSCNVPSCKITDAWSCKCDELALLVNVDPLTLVGDDNKAPGDPT